MTHVQQALSHANRVGCLVSSRIGCTSTVNMGDTVAVVRRLSRCVNQVVPRINARFETSGTRRTSLPCSRGYGDLSVRRAPALSLVLEVIGNGLYSSDRIQ